jgi:ABC-type Na+ transport system ATPase subunit NatA
MSLSDGLGFNEAREKDEGIYKRGKTYKVGENCVLVERFKDIILTSKEDGSDTLYTKRFHAFIRQFDM